MQRRLATNASPHGAAAAAAQVTGVLAAPPQLPEGALVCYTHALPSGARSQQGVAPQRSQLLHSSEASCCACLRLPAHADTPALQAALAQRARQRAAAADADAGPGAPPGVIGVSARSDVSGAARAISAALLCQGWAEVASTGGSTALMKAVQVCPPVPADCMRRRTAARICLPDASSRLAPCCCLPACLLRAQSVSKARGVLHSTARADTAAVLLDVWEKVLPARERQWPQPQPDNGAAAAPAAAPAAAARSEKLATADAAPAVLRLKCASFLLLCCKKNAPQALLDPAAAVAAASTDGAS